MKMRLRTETEAFEVELNGTKAAKAIYAKLPMESTVSTWGDEIYFDVAVRLLQERATTKIGIGDVAYWPQGPSLCVFFGPTPISKGGDPKPAGAVTIIGHTDCLPGVLKKITAGQKIIVEK